MAKYVGQEHALYLKICKKYNVQPEPEIKADAGPFVANNKFWVKDLRFPKVHQPQAVLGYRLPVVSLEAAAEACLERAVVQVHGSCDSRPLTP